MEAKEEILCYTFIYTLPLFITVKLEQNNRICPGDFSFLYKYVWRHREEVFMIDHYQNYKLEQQHERAVNQFLSSVSVPTDYLYYDNVVEYSTAKQLLKSNILNDHDRRVLDLFTRHWVIKHGTIDQARLEDIQRRLQYYTHKQNNMALRQKRLQRKAVKKIAVLKKPV